MSKKYTKPSQETVDYAMTHAKMAMAIRLLKKLNTNEVGIMAVQSAFRSQCAAAQAIAKQNNLDLDLLVEISGGPGTGK